jgi:hypothetical protein
VKNVFPQVDERLIGVLTTIAVAALALKSARAAIRAQSFIMGAIGLSLLSFFLGSAVGPPDTVTVPLAEVPRENFWVVFAVFFPAVTGIMAGVNMSGDLKEPGTSIPRGTIAAVLVGYAIYMIVPVFLAMRADHNQLIQEPLIMRRMALWGDAIVLGVWGATLSSAVGSILGAPRVLQALARDGVLPESLRWLGRGSGPEDAPRVGTVVTLGIALAAVALGNLNIIAPVLTMFFLTTYGVLNISAGLERLLGSPSFRPHFRVPWYVSALGAVGCGGVMFLVNAAATIVAVVVVLAIYIWLERRELKSAWGDVRRGIWMALTRAGLLRLRTSRDPKNWRPHLLVLSGSPTRRWYLIEFADWLSHRRALITVSSVITDESVTLDRQRAMETAIHDYLARRGVQALIRLIRAPDPFEGAERLVEAYGLGELSPNTYLVGDSEVPEHRDAYCRMIARFHEGRRNVVVLHHNEDLRFGHHERIDVWWGGLKRNGGCVEGGGRARQDGGADDRGRGRRAAQPGDHRAWPEEWGYRRSAGIRGTAVHRDHEGIFPARRPDLPRHARARRRVPGLLREDAGHGRGNADSGVRAGGRGHAVRRHRGEARGVGRPGSLRCMGPRTYQRTTAPPHVNPDPNAVKPTRSPRWMRPSFTHSCSASGMLAAVVFPYRSMLLYILSSASPNPFATAWEIRRFAWCGITIARSSSE